MYSSQNNVSILNAIYGPPDEAIRLQSVIIAPNYNQISIASLRAPGRYLKGGCPHLALAPDSPLPSSFYCLPRSQSLIAVDFY